MRKRIGARGGVPVGEVPRAPVRVNASVSRVKVKTLHAMGAGWRTLDASYRHQRRRKRDPEVERERLAAFYWNHLEAERAKRREWYQKNREAAKARAREAYYALSADEKRERIERVRERERERRAIAKGTGRRLPAKLSVRELLLQAEAVVGRDGRRSGGEDR